MLMIYLSKTFGSVFYWRRFHLLKAGGVLDASQGNYLIRFFYPIKLNVFNNRLSFYYTVQLCLINLETNNLLEIYFITNFIIGNSILTFRIASISCGN